MNNSSKHQYQTCAWRSARSQSIKMKAESINNGNGENRNESSAIISSRRQLSANRENENGGENVMKIMAAAYQWRQWRQ